VESTHKGEEKIINALANRIRDVILSIYLFNEHRGYTYLEKLAEAFRQKYPDDHIIIRAIEKHARDERTHYELFKNYFLQNGRQPFQIGAFYGYCDQMVKAIFGTDIAGIDPERIMRDEQAIYRLCRAIMVTERRGMSQVAALLRQPVIKSDPELARIFAIVEKDEPSHTFPYQHWLKKHQQEMPALRERIADAWIHYSLLLIKIPYLFFNLRQERRADFPCGARHTLAASIA
jgi:hypothetical protein